ncbi:MAG TPA: IS3 family transposase [Candidatus Paceibacterota bacterium]
MKSSQKSVIARELGISRGMLYYRAKKPDKDWRVKCSIEEVLREYPSYGHKRLAIHLRMNHKKILRVMKLYGIKPYRRRGKKPFKINKKSNSVYPNLLLTEYPQYENHIWVSDFTYIPYKGRFIYLATVEDLFTRKIVGYSVLTNHSVQLTINALLSALHSASRPVIFHSDNGSEYDAKDFITLISNVGILISRSAPGCPWENGYQESFYDKFKIDLGDPNRFEILGELVYEIYRLIHVYNNTRIHTSLKMSPVQFALKAKNATILDVE